MRPASLSLLGFVAGVSVALLGVWLVGGFSNVEYVSVPVVEARLVDAESSRVALTVGSCNGAPKAEIGKGSEYVEIEVRAFRFKNEREFCLDGLEVFLNRSDLGPLPEEILDVHTGDVVRISRDP